MAKPTAATLQRAVKLSRLPGVTLADACKRFGVSRSALAAARRTSRDHPTTADLALAALTRNGETREGTFTDLAGIGTWLDYVDKNPHTAGEVRQLLETFATAGILAIDGDRWRLLADWP